MAMALDILSADEKKECEALVGERTRIEGTLAAEGGPDPNFLLSVCADISDLMDDLQEVSGKMGEIGYAALDTKIKFSKKVRRKGKEVGRFEQKLVHAYDQKRISLGHLQKMAGIVRLLKSNKLDRAREEAGEFLQLLEKSERLKVIELELAKKKVLVEKAKRSMSAQMLDVEWLEKEPAPDLEKTGRHEEVVRIRESLPKIRADCVQSIRSIASGELLRKIRDEGLEKLGFPAISGEELESLSAYLRKTGLESKTCGQLLELSELSTQRLRYLAIDLGKFKQEVMGHKVFLEQAVGLHSSEFLTDYSQGSPALAHLSAYSEEARKAVERMAELDRSAEEDEREWGRVQEIGRKKAGLAGVEKDRLAESLRELEVLENILNEKTGLPKEEISEGRPAEMKKDERKAGSGTIWTFLKSLIGK